MKAKLFKEKINKILEKVNDDSEVTLVCKNDFGSAMVNDDFTLETTRNGKSVIILAKDMEKGKVE